MKLLLLSCLLSLNLQATTLGQYMSSPDGSSVQSFKITSSKTEYEKKSNFFDSSKDLSLGVFELSPAQDISKEQAQLNKTLSKIKTVDELLKKKNSSFNELSSKKPHDSFIFLESYRISQNSDLYPELKTLYDQLASRRWKQVSGIKLSEDLQKVLTIKNGKEVSKDQFNFAFHCKKSEAPTTCLYKDFGILYVQ